MKKYGFSKLARKLRGIIVFLILMSGGLATAGTRDGGGGIGVQCALGSPTLQILDFYESENIYGLAPLKSEASLELEILARLNRLSSLSYDPTVGRWNPDVKTARGIINSFNQQADFVSKVLPLTNDATKPILRPGCDFVQIAVYLYSDKILIQKNLWQNLDIRNRAGLIMHEYLYHSRRQSGDNNSDQTRKYVGELFSKSSMQPKYSDMPHQDVLWCTTEGNAGDRDVLSFYVYYSVEESSYVANFSQLGISGIIWWRATASLGPINILNGSYNSFDVTSRLKSEIDNGRFDFRFSKDTQNPNIFVSLLDTKSGQNIKKPFRCRKAN